MPVNVIGTLKPKNNGKFPVAEAVDIKVTDDLRLDEALENKADLSTLNFALAGKANASDVTGSVQNLQGQIDQIAQAAGSGSADTEVAQARVNSSGITYGTLKERIDKAEISSKVNFIKYNCADILQFFGDFSNVSINGIDFVWNGDTCTINGTSTGVASCNLYQNANAIPTIIERGKTYKVLFNESTNKIEARIGVYINDEWSWTYVTRNTEIEYSVPNNATGFAVRVWIPTTGTTVSNAIISLRILNNFTLNEVVEKIGDAINDISDINSDLSGLTVFEENSKILANYNCNEYLINFADFSTITSKGVTYTWNKNTCTAVGTTTGLSFCDLYINDSELPYGIIPGNKYRCINTNTEAGLAIRIGAYVNGAWTWRDLTRNTEIEYEVPQGAVGFAVRVWIPSSGVTINETFSVHIFNTYTNVELYDKLKDLLPLAEEEPVINLGVFDDEDDLDDHIATGYSIFPYANEYDNDPIGKSNRRLFLCFKNGSTPYQIIFNAGNGEGYIRFKVGGAFSDWKSFTSVLTTRVNNLEQTINQYIDDLNVLSSNNVEISGTHNNSGLNLRIMSYNVAHYNNDTATYLSDTKITNFKKMLYKVKPDIIGLQENKPYIDDISKGYKEYLFNPALSNAYGSTECAIVSKFTASDSGRNLLLTDGRRLEYAVFTLENKKILFVSTHPVANYNGTGAESAETIAMRETQYTDIFEWVNHEKSLRTYESASELISAPEWDYAIITIDANSITADDKSNLSTLASSYDFSMANGGYLGWFETSRTKDGTMVYAIDNIICSSNIIINSVDVYGDMYSSLYSDHYPIAADITLI